jgi:MscS family membrane protein
LKLRWVVLSLASAFFVVTGAFVGPASAQRDGVAAQPGSGTDLRAVRTESPRDTLESFLRVRRNFTQTILQYRTDKSPALARQLGLLSAQALALIDLSALPVATRRERGEETVMVLLDIFGRIQAPVLDDVPNIDAVADRDGKVLWRIPNTPLKIGLIETGPRKGEYLFTGQTVLAAPRFLSGISERQLTPRMPFSSWTDMSRQITGPLVPAWLERAIPDQLKPLWLDTPAWKILLMFAINVVAVILALLLHKVLKLLAPKAGFFGLIGRMITPLALLAVLSFVVPTISRNINLSGSATEIQEFARTIALYATWSWLFWLAIRAVFEAVILTPRISEESYDANMLRLISGILGVVGVILILAYGGQELGLPVMSLLAGLGIGGLAIALAIRPTLENLIGGFTLFIDKPVRVGDFCAFGGQKGTVESIGIRSTQIRALDRTLISVPNAQFADMQLVNWARCDQLLIHETIGVRYETTPDQLRFLLAAMREMLHCHPRIDPHTIRVRFAGYGESSLDIDVRIYAKTREWNDYFAIREDVFLRIYELVTDAGTGFAFPSQTVYLNRDGGMDDAAQNAAEQTVQDWRDSGRLPFPRFPQSWQSSLEGTLDYPPHGSAESVEKDTEGAVELETLSSDEDDNRDGKQGAR